MKQYIVVITCDVNDADYIKSHFEETEEGLEELRRLYNTVQRLRQSYYDIIKNDKYVSLCYRDKLPYYGDMMLSILKKYDWCYSDDTVGHLDWVNSLSEGDIEDALRFYELLPRFDNEEVHTIVSIEAYEVVGEKIDLV